MCVSASRGQEKHRQLRADELLLQGGDWIWGLVGFRVWGLGFGFLGSPVYVGTTRSPSASLKSHLPSLFETQSSSPQPFQKRSTQPSPHSMVKPAQAPPNPPESSLSAFNATILPGVCVATILPDNDFVSYVHFVFPAWMFLRNKSCLAVLAFMSTIPA